MAKYTLTLDEARALFTPEQQLAYASCFALAGVEDLNNGIRNAFETYYGDREIANGTPAGFINDMTDVFNRYKDVILAMFNEFKLDGYFTASYADSSFTETRTPNLTHTRTPNITTENGGSQIYSDTPDSSGVVSGGYASAVTKNNSTVTSTGTETTTETGNELRNYTLTKTTPHGSVWDMLLEEKRSIIDSVLSYFAPCFILLY